MCSGALRGCWISKLAKGLVQGWFRIGSGLVYELEWIRGWWLKGMVVENSFRWVSGRGLGLVALRVGA